MSRFVENGCEVPHVRDREDGVEQPALLAVAFTERREQTVAQHAVHRARMGSMFRRYTDVRNGVDSREELRGLFVYVLVLHDDALESGRIEDEQLPCLHSR